MQIKILVFVNSLLFCLGINTFNAVYPRYNRPEIFRNEQVFFLFATLLFFSYVGFIVWSFFKITWYVDALIIIATFIISPFLLTLMPNSLTRTALGLIVPAILIPILFYLVAK